MMSVLQRLLSRHPELDSGSGYECLQIPNQVRNDDVCGSLNV